MSDKPKNGTAMKDRPKPPPPEFCFIAERLVAAGLDIPVPLQRALDRKTQPLSRGAREEWEVWAMLKGYSDAQTSDLTEALAGLVRSRDYQHALAADLAERFDVDGKPVEPVSDSHRAGAILLLMTRALHQTQPKVAEPVKSLTKAMRPILGLPKQARP